MVWVRYQPWWRRLFVSVSVTVRLHLVTVKHFYDKRICKNVDGLSDFLSLFQIVLENSSREDKHECPFGRSSIELTKMLCETLKVGELRKSLLTILTSLFLLDHIVLVGSYSLGRKRTETTWNCPVTDYCFCSHSAKCFARVCTNEYNPDLLTMVFCRCYGCWAVEAGERSYRRMGSL